MCNEFFKCFGFYLLSVPQRILRKALDAFLDHCNVRIEHLDFSSHLHGHIQALVLLRQSIVDFNLQRCLVFRKLLRLASQEPFQIVDLLAVIVKNSDWALACVNVENRFLE